MREMFQLACVAPMFGKSEKEDVPKPPLVIDVPLPYWKQKTVPLAPQPAQPAGFWSTMFSLIAMLNSLLPEGFLWAVFEYSIWFLLPPFVWVCSVVYKLGGASDGTQGRVKDYKLVNRSVDLPISSLINGELVQSTHIRFHAWRIISQDHSSPFSKPGDSSAGVNDKEERLIGQLHSGFYDGASVPVTYMNAIDDVFRDVEDAIPGIHIPLSIPEPSLLKSITRGL